MISYISKIPNLITHFQDTTATTIAQGTAVGPRITQSEQSTETIITSTLTTSSEFPVVDTTTILPSSTESTTDSITTSTMTTTTLPTISTKSSQTELTTTVESMTETIIPAININENLISTEMTTTDTRDTTVASTEPEELMTTKTITPTAVTNMPSTTTPQITTSNRIMSPFIPFGVPNMRSYPGSFNGNQATTLASRFSSSSKAPVRDYQIYGIYPNKTIVRKRPEDNLIDARNIDSPYVIFGIFPDGKLVRKFPNGTIITDSPRNPVEVVFTLSSTTTNRPTSGAYYNQVNQAGIYNQYQTPVYYSNPVYYSRPMDNLMDSIQSSSPDFGLIGNAIGIPPGVGPKFTTSFGFPANSPCANKMVFLSDLFKIILYSGSSGLKFNQEFFEFLRKFHFKK